MKLLGIISGQTLSRYVINVYAVSLNLHQSGTWRINGKDTGDLCRVRGLCALSAYIPRRRLLTLHPFLDISRHSSILCLAIQPTIPAKI